MLRLIFKSRFSYFDNAYLFLCIGLGGWWLLGIIPFSILSGILEEATHPREP